MKTRILPFVFVFATLYSMGQTRIYVVGGFTGTTGGNLSTYTAHHAATPLIELTVEKKIVGSISLLTGLSYFGATYNNTKTFFGSASKFDARFLGVPVLARWNIGNKNLFFVDLGLQPYYLLTAQLEESIPVFNEVLEAKGDIAAYSNRYYLSARLQQTFVINRFTISMIFMLPFHGQNSIKDLADHWPLNQQQSTYLLSNGYSDFTTYGLSLGFRLR